MSIYYVCWLFDVPSEGVPDFVAAFREGGRWYDLSRCLAGHLHTDLLSRPANPPSHSRFLTLTFFTSMDVLVRAQQSVDVQAFIRWLHDHTSVCICLGTYTFLPEPEQDFPVTVEIGRRHTVEATG